MSIELKACPSCGPDGHPEVHGSLLTGGRFVRCEICGMQGPTKLTRSRNIQKCNAMNEAIAAWNARATPSAEVIALLVEALESVENCGDLAAVRIARQALARAKEMMG